jgi:hypothetical protein
MATGARWGFGSRAVRGLFWTSCLVAAITPSAHAEPDRDEHPPAGETGDDAADDESADDEAADNEAADDEAADGETKPTIVQVAPNRHLQVKARSLRLTEESADRLRRIAARFHSETGRQIVITGGDRGADRQAALMYKKLENGEDLLKLYARDDLVLPVVAAYRAGKGASRSKDAVTRSMTRIIEDQMAHKEYLSRHLDFTAADVRSRDLTPEQVDALIGAVRAEPGVQLVDERDSAAPCFHLTL